MPRTETFTDRINDALDNEQLHSNFRSAMNYLMEKRRDKFSDTERLNNLRNITSSIRSNSLSKLADLLIKLEEKLEKNNITVQL